MRTLAILIHQMTSWSFVSIFTTVNKRHVIIRINFGDQTRIFVSLAKARPKSSAIWTNCFKTRTWQTKNLKKRNDEIPSITFPLFFIYCFVYQKNSQCVPIPRQTKLQYYFIASFFDLHPFFVRSLIFPINVNYRRPLFRKRTTYFKEIV